MLKELDAGYPSCPTVPGTSIAILDDMSLKLTFKSQTIPYCPLRSIPLSRLLRISRQPSQLGLKTCHLFVPRPQGLRWRPFSATPRFLETSERRRSHPALVLLRVILLHTTSYPTRICRAFSPSPLPSFCYATNNASANEQPRTRTRTVPVGRLEVLAVLRSRNDTLGGRVVGHSRVLCDTRTASRQSVPRRAH